jgi:hypothetical protein
VLWIIEGNEERAPRVNKTEKFLDHQFECTKGDRRLFSTNKLYETKIPNFQIRQDKIGGSGGVYPDPTP